MGRLITLVLQPSGHKRGSSSLSTLESFTATPSSAPRTSSTKPLRERRRSSSSLLPALPYTHKEWKATMEEVKALFFKRRFYQATTRCKQVLDSTQDPYLLHPLYSIYLCFYAASSLEQTARSLHNSSKKLPLFEEALSYYAKAESQIEYASLYPELKAICLSTERTKHRSKSSTSSSNWSSVDSIFSTTSATPEDSAPPSPVEDESHTRNTYPAPLFSSMGPAPIRIRKRVSFSHQLPTLSSQSELCFEYLDSRLIDNFPAPPRSQSLSSDREQDSCPNPAPLTHSYKSSALARYRSCISTFSSQIAYHTFSVKEQVTTASSNNISDYSHAGDGIGLGIGGINRVEKGYQRKVELQERIRRLKEKGWERKRFEAEKYQVLCQKALKELEGYY